MNDEMIILLTEIRDLLKENLAASKVLAERRERHRLRMKSVRAQTLTEKEERKEVGEKEKSPHSPLKGKEGEEKGEEKAALSARTRTRTFKPPSAEEVAAYCLERNNGIDPEQFIAFYESKGWMIGKNKMKSWKSAVITWEKRHKEEVKNATRGKRLTANQSCIVDYDLPL